MSRDTGPAELAELLQNEEKRKLWTILKLQEISTDLAQHIVDDKAQFAALHEWRGSVTSSVTPLTDTRNKLAWSWKMVASVLIGIAFIVDLAAHAKELLK